jgi:DNA-binding transcriptional regulator WhiA
MAKKEKPFTVKQGLAIQASNMAFWKKLLKKKRYEILEEIVAKKNKEIKARDGYAVYRGSDISTAVQNLVYTREQLGLYGKCTPLFFED